MPRPKILYVIDSEGYSGAEIILKNLINLNTEVVPTVVCKVGEFSSLFSDSIDVRNTNFLQRTHVSKKGNLLKAIPSIFFNIVVFTNETLKIVREIKPNVIHVNSFIPSIYFLPALLICKLFGNVKTVWHHHDSSHSFNQTLNKLAWRINLLLYNIVIVPSNSCKSFLSKKELDKIYVLYTGLEPQSIHNYLHIDKNSERISIGIAGRLIPLKGHDLLLDAIKALQMKSIKVALIIAGRIDYQDTYHKFLLDKIDQENIQNVLFLGHIKDMSTFYQEIDILVCPTKAKLVESLGTTIIEGLAFGKVVVASNIGGTPEIIDDGINGFTFQADNIDHLIFKLEEAITILRDENRIENMVSSAQKKIDTVFSIAKMKDSYNKIIKKLLND